MPGLQHLYSWENFPVNLTEADRQIQQTSSQQPETNQPDSPASTKDTVIVMYTYYIYIYILTWDKYYFEKDCIM